MKAMILAAGVGSHLDPLTHSIPKPMIPVVNRPVMEYVVELLQKHGFDEIIVNLHFLGEQIKSHFGDGSRWNVKMHWNEEDRLWGDAGSVKRAEKFLGEDTFLVIGGDDLAELDLTRLWQIHRESRPLMTMALSPVNDPSLYGVAMLNEGRNVARFMEKPQGDQIFSNFANTGIYMFEPDIFGLLPRNTHNMFGTDIIPMLLHHHKRIAGHLTASYWKDVGDLSNYQQAHRDILAGRTYVSPVWTGDNVEIDSTANISYPVVIGNNVKIMAGASILANSIIGDDCIVGEHATIEDTILWHGAEIAANTSLKGCVVGYNCKVNSSAYIYGGIICNQTE